MIADVEARKALEKRFSVKIAQRRWLEIAAELGVNRGDVYGVWKGQHSSNKVRRALGMPERQTIKVVPCNCGAPHLHSCQVGRKIAQRAQSRHPDILAGVQDIAVPFLRDKRPEVTPEGRRHRRAAAQERRKSRLDERQVIRATEGD